MSALAPFGDVVDGHALVQMLWSGAAAGIGVTCIFAIAIHGATRAVDASRDGRPAEAAIFGVVGLLAIAAVGAAVVLGIVVMAQK
jgi:hypothetical protein